MTDIPSGGLPISQVAEATTLCLLTEIRKLFPDIKAVDYRAGYRPNRDVAWTRLLSPKLSVDVAAVCAPDALVSRLYFTAIAPVIAELIAHTDKHTAMRRGEVVVGVWLEREAHRLQYFAWLEALADKG